MTKQNVLTTFLLGLFGVSGPLAKFLATHYNMDNGTIEFILTIGQMATPLAAGGVYWFMNTLAAKIAAIQAMPAAAQAQIAAALPVEAKIADAANMPLNEATRIVSATPIEARVASAASLTGTDAVQVAAALPDAANLAAVNAMPEVTKVVVKDNASDGVGTALKDSSLEKVVPLSQQEDGKS